MPPKFLKSRTGVDAVSDMKFPALKANDVKSAQSLKQEPGLEAVQHWAPVLEALAMKGYYTPTSSASVLTTTNVSKATAAAAASTSSSSAAAASSASLLKNERIFHPIPKPGRGDWLEEREEKGQNFTSFLRGQFRARPHGAFDTICIVIVGNGIPNLPQLSEYVATFFQGKVSLVGPVDIDDAAKFPTLKYRMNSSTKTRQYYTTPLMEFCQSVVNNDKELRRKACCTIGVTMYDLTPNDDYNFVYGIASLTDGRGVFSLARFHPEFNGEPYANQQEADKIIFKRSCKIVTHELTHIFGLRHCINYVCLMNGCNHCREMERQPLLECPVCAQKLICSWGWDLKKRYSEMINVSLKFGFLEEAERWKQCLEMCP
jgi:archaemetzincin